MLDDRFIKEKINLIIRDLKYLEPYRSQTIDELAKDPYKYAALKNFLMEIIGRGIDINQHLIAEKADLILKAPLEYGKTFLLLGDIKILPAEFAKTIAGSAGFRNAIVHEHEYDEIDETMVCRTINEAIEQYTKYCDYIMKFLDKNQ